MTARVAGFLVVAATLLLAGPPAPAEASLKSLWGPNTLPDGRSAFPTYRRLGVDILQHQVIWGEVADARPSDPRNPNDPAYRWDPELDAAVSNARRYGIRVALMVKDSPNWAKGGRSGSRPPNRVSDYTDFLVAVSRRYPSVRHWMIWGEPTRAYNWMPSQSRPRYAARRYAALLDRSYRTLKRRTKRNIVIGGMSFTTGDVSAPRWLRWMRLPSGRRPRMDWYGHNAFSVRSPRLSRDTYYPGLRDFSDLDTLHREIRRAYRGRRTPRIWVSEFAVSSDRGNRAFSFSVSRRTQARWLRSAYRISRSKRYIAGVGWYKLLDESGSNGVTTGLLTADGTPKPAFYAFKRAR